MPSRPISFIWSRKSATRSGIGALEKRAVDADAKALGLGELDRLDGRLVDAVEADRRVMHGLVAVEVDRPGEHRVGLVLVDLLGEQQGVRAKDHVLFTVEKSAHDLWHVAMQQRFPAGDRNHRRAALVDRLHALIEATGAD